MLLVLWIFALVWSGSGVNIAMWMRQRNLQQLESFVATVSDIHSPQYGKYLTQEALAEMVGSNAVILQQVGSFCRSAWGASTVEEAPSRDKLYCFGVNETALQWVDGEHWQSGVIVPTELHPHVEAISALWDKPGRSQWGFGMRPTAPHKGTDLDGSVYGTPSNYRKAFGIPDTMVGKTTNKQMVWGPGTYGVLKSDVEKYINKYKVPETIDVIDQVGYKGVVGGDNFGEAELDTQVITGVAPGVLTYVANTNKTKPTEEGPGFGWAFMDFLNTLTGDAEYKTNVLSISLGSLAYESCSLLCNGVVKLSKGKYTYKECMHYVEYEQRQVCQYSNDYVETRANTELMKLSSLGVTVVTAAGDGGCHYSYHPFSGSPMADYLNQLSCSHTLPVFPCSSPYVTCVGGTSWMTPTGSKKPKLWRGGGSGFSRNFPMQQWQKTVVDEYIKKYNNTPEFASWGSYNHTARAYPDVAGLATDVPMYFMGSLVIGAGTSASTPAVAGFLSMVNQYRIDNGKPLLGFANPLIYQLGAKSASGSFLDVSEGNSRCPSGGQCCPNGFPATPGWDAATGWGRPLWEGFVSSV
eukprot:NODE_60_length_1854_cov_421.672843_g59_i0.p1 GENE.NODE_60_length_1854_cov_421.672843_g59_i0~~NODE_60_length_1854_cov_421.672843_g59_i0.p1  ORF type:complete len:580 (-),score=132.34 NODE_60_length_1854_cov_421.672843_g59_i0:56-1795(-)